MSWAGESNQSGICILTDEAPSTIVGESGSILRWSGQGPQFTNRITIDDNGNIVLHGTVTSSGIIINTNTTLLNNQRVIICATPGINVYLPSNPILWQIHDIKDGTGQAKQNPITIYGNGKYIDGNETLRIRSNYTCITVLYANSQWNII